MTERQRVANPTQFHASTSPAAGRPKVRFRNLSHKCKTDFQSKKEFAVSFSKDRSMQIQLGLVSNELHLFIFKTWRTCQLCAMLLTCIKSIGFGCELKDVQGFLIFLKGHSESIDFIMFCAQWVRFSETTMRKYVCNFGNRRHFEAVWLATCRCLGYLEVTYIKSCIQKMNPTGPTCTSWLSLGLTGSPTLTRAQRGSGV